MIEVSLTPEAQSIARQRYEAAQKRREREATTPDEYARRAQACVGVGTFALLFDGFEKSHAAFGDAACRLVLRVGAADGLLLVGAGADRGLVGL